MWEDPANEKGGKWVSQLARPIVLFSCIHMLTRWSRLRRKPLKKCGEISRWQVLASSSSLGIVWCVTDFDVHLVLQCGLVLSIRKGGDTINVWNSRGDLHHEVDTTTSELRKLIGNSSIRYQLHRVCDYHLIDAYRFLQAYEPSHYRSPSLDKDKKNVSRSSSHRFANNYEDKYSNGASGKAIRRSPSDNVPRSVKSLEDRVELALSAQVRYPAWCFLPSQSQNPKSHSGQP